MSIFSVNIDESIRTSLMSAIPESDLTISEWAEKYRILSAERSARPGNWSNELVPFLTEIMDTISDPAIHKIIFMKSSQVGGTEVCNNVIGYFSHIDPSTILYIAENELKARAWSTEALAPMIRDTPELRNIFGSPKQRDTSNTIPSKGFRGGHLAIAWSTSPAMLSSRPRRIVLADEVDGMETTKEGNPVKLAEARTKTYNENKKIILVSSPRIKDTSQIEPEYLASDRREFHVPCPDCNEFQTLRWSNIQWDEGDAENAYYICAECGVIIVNEQKPEMLAAGKWIAQGEAKGVAGFRINELYSPFTEWGDMALDFLQAKKFRDTLMVFVNTRLGETWEDIDEELEYEVFKFNEKIEHYNYEVPEGVLVLTAGVDVQDDRLEVEVVGWGRNRENWSIDYKVIYGSPSLPDVWESLHDYLLREFEGQGMPFYIQAACIDTGGHHTDQVYKFCKAHQGKRWFAIKGASVSGKPLASKPSIVGSNKVRLFTIGTDVAKDEIFSFLRVDDIGSPGYCHFPDYPHYDEAHFRQICAEKKVDVFVQGVAKQKYVKVSASARNEALDCRVYATAARGILNPNFGRLAANLEKKLPKSDEKVAEQEENTQNESEKRVKTTPVSRRRQQIGRYRNLNWR